MDSKLLALYRQRCSAFQEQQDKAQRVSNGVSWLRLIFFLLAAGVFFYGLYGPFAGIEYLSLPPAAVFVALVIKHKRLQEEIDFLNKLVKINTKAVLRLEWKWTSFPERGDHYVDLTHPYSSDLNIFGQGSLFQYVDATTSFRGERLLADMLSRPALAEEIEQRQEAISELSSRLDFRQNFQASGMEGLFKKQDPQDVLSWAEENVHRSGKWPSAILYLPLLTLVMFILALLGLVIYLPAGILLGIQIIVALPGERKAQERFAKTDKAVQRLKRYEKLMQWVEQEDFKAPFLISQKERLFSQEQPASHHLKKIVHIADRNNLRFSNGMIYLILKYAVLWDLWTLKMLDDWQFSYGKSVRSWFEAVGEVEALSSLAGLCHDNRHWVFPTVWTGAPGLQAEDLGHPLIYPGERVGNHISLSGPGRFFIITGSNMSGKSTLLRTVGINLVLAYAGAPVCAAKLDCAMMQIYSKMQIHDNLEERVSTFYGELKRIKMILDAAQSGAPLLILLDEIFRGTNPRDRIFATRNIISQLQKLNVIGLLTTHDHELAELEKEYSDSISNYHFTDEVRNGELYFDYKIKPGIARSGNAGTLMKMIGIEVSEGES